MADLPMFTLVTPSFNQGRFISDTIQSVLAQRRGGVEIEYVVVDGMSTDQTPQVIERFADRIDRVIREPDRGQTDAINKGFAAARGTIIGWLNSDDYLFPGAVRRAAEAFAADPSLDVVYGDCVVTNENGGFVRYFTEIRPFDRDVLLNHSNFIQQPGCFFRRAAVERIGGLRTELQYVMDWDLWCRLAKAGCGFRYVPVLFAAAREYGTTKTLSGGAARQREIRAMHREHRTSVVPWAAISFALGERLKRLAGPGRTPTIYRWVRRGKRLLRREPQMDLYGIEAHGNRLHPSFRIALPWYGPRPRALALTLASSRRTPIDLNGVQAACEGTQRIEAPLADVDGIIDVRGSHAGHATLRLRGAEVLT